MWRYGWHHRTCFAARSTMFMFVNRFIWLSLSSIKLLPILSPFTACMNVKMIHNITWTHHQSSLWILQSNNNTTTVVIPQWLWGGWMECNQRPQAMMQGGQTLHHHSTHDSWPIEAQYSPIHHAFSDDTSTFMIILYQLDFISRHNRMWCVLWIMVCDCVCDFCNSPQMIPSFAEKGVSVVCCVSDPLVNSKTLWNGV